MQIYQYDNQYIDGLFLQRGQKKHKKYLCSQNKLIDEAVQRHSHQRGSLRFKQHLKEKIQKNCLLKQLPSNPVDKNTLKLQKNRQSAKKARLRKKIYIKMLESQIECFKKIKTEGDQLNQEMESFLNNKNSQKKNIQMNQYITHDVNVDKFLSGSDLGQVYKIESKEYEKKLKERDRTIEELYQLSTSSLIKKLKGSKNLEVFQPILKRQARQNMKGFQALIKRIAHNYDAIKNSFRKIHELTEQTKKLSRFCNMNGIDHYDMIKFTGDLLSVQQFMEKLDINRQSELIEQPTNHEMIEQVHHNYDMGSVNKKSNLHSNDFNLCSTEKLLIRSQKFFQHTLFEEEQ